jgi:uncharacterized membrane protein
MTPRTSDGEEGWATAPAEFAVAPARKRGRALWRTSLSLVLLIWWRVPSRADFRVCNKTRVLINLAVGVNAGSEFATEGWWTVTPGSCATPIRGRLTGRYVYLYATNIDNADVLKGTVSMCVDRGKFKVYGINDCWRRGLQAVNFAEIDTLDSPDWTTFLTEVGK